MTRRLPIPRLVFARRRAQGEARAEQTADARFHRLVLPHLDSAWTYARYLAREDHTAEDVVQEAFLRAFRSSHTCQGDGKSWLMAIVRNCWHDWLRANRQNPEAVVEDDPREEETPHVQAERQNELRHLRAMLAALPEPFREALVLRELEEFSYREISAVTGAPMGTVMSRLARGREMLATLMQASREKGDEKAIMS